MATRSPLAPDGFPNLPPVAGVRVAGGACDLKPDGAHDLFLAVLEPGARVAGVFTRSRCPSGPVDWCRRVLPGGLVRTVVANSGNANAFTGTAGDRTVEQTVRAAADLFDCRAEQVFIASTGVIGVPLPEDAIGSRLPGLARRLSPDGWEGAAKSIMTTDTFPKGATRQATIGGTSVMLNGIAKGSGMIGPDMATMLAFLFTDAAIPAPALQALLERSANRSFNSITVDGDTSTSDTVLLCASGRGPAHPAIESSRDRHLRDFGRALEDLMIDLATQIVRDGEGARKFVTIEVRGAASARAARRVGLAIANSPLVKTAIAGEDANWGRIVMAVGKAGEKADRDRLGIAIGGIQITRNGQVVAAYDETPVAAHMKSAEILVQIDLGVGRGRGRVWTCDLTHDYIRINADYRS